MKKIDTFQAFARGAKSLVAILLVMLMAVGNLFAQTTYTFSNYTEGTQYAIDEQHVLDDVLTIYTTECHFRTDQLRIYSSTSHNGFFYSNALPNNIDSISFNIGYKVDNLLVYGSTDGLTWTLVGSIATTENYTDRGIGFGNNEFNYFKCDVEGDQQLRITSFTMFYKTTPEPPTPIVVDAPTFAPEAGTYTAAQNVTIACATEGAAIYYTLDGTEPTSGSLIYQGAISVDEDMTIKAIAILGEDQSTVATANYVINLPLTVANIAAFKALDLNTEATITGDVTVLGQHSNYLFVQDATAALVVFGSTGNNYNAGDVISGGIKGKRAVYNGMNQMSNPASFTAGVAGTPVEPIVVSAADLIANYATYEGKLVTIENVELAANHTFTASGADRGVDVTQGESTITVYDQFKVITGETVSAGAKTVTGYLIKYVSNNTTKYEIFPRGAADIVDYVAPIQPLDLDSIATLPYTYNFDEGTDPYFMINNGENTTNAWYVGQAQGFDNNKLYISSNNGTTNKYDVTKASNVMAYRTVMVPETGAILSFDYRVNGQANNDYLKVNLVKGETTTEIATLQGENDWASFSYDISGEMAGEVCIQFNWVNNATNGEQFPAAIDNISVIETPCSQPTALTATVDSTTAVISWVAIEGQTAWNFQYKLANHSEWYTVPATETTVTLNDLQGNSNYEMRVQAVCGENVSAWTTGSFAVDCQTKEVVTAPDNVLVGDGTSTYYYLPVNMYYNYSLTQQLYTPAEIGSEGNIYSISFYYTYSSSFSMSDVKLYMKNVNKTAFESNTDMVEVSNNDLVWEGTFSASASGWVTINLPTPFEYDGTSNLLVCMYDPTSGYASQNCKFRTTTTSNYSSITWYSDSYVPEINATSFSGNKSYNKYHNNLMLNRDVTTITCSDVVSCETPSNLEVPEAGITPNSAVLTWTAGAENQTAFIVEYQAEGATEWTSVDVNDTTYTLTELAQLTNYSVKVKANCGENNWSEVLTTSFRTIGICPPVTNLETANVSNTTTLTWTAGGEETAWLVQFKPATAGDDAWTSIEVSLIPMTTFGGLVGNVDYNVRVKALCDPADEENQSEWTSTTFHSGCAAFDLPFAEEFNATAMPTCWEGSNYTFSSGRANSTVAGAALITPAINIPAENPTYLSFEVRGAGEYSILASYRGTRADRFTEIYTGTAPNQNTVVTIALDDLYKGRAVNFKIVNNSTSYQYFYFVKVNQCPFEVTNLVSTDYTGTTVALAWTADEAATNYQIQYGEQGFELGDGTVVDVIGATENTISQLNYETTYDFYVRVVCEGDNGPWYGPVSVTTAPACSDPNGLSFESVSAQLSWNAGEWGAPAQYNVRYKAENDAEYNYTSVIPVDMPGYTPFATISGLASNTTYEMGVQSVCGENMESNWVTLMVTTPCMPIAVTAENPYIEGFDGVDFVPECWSKEDNGTYAWSRSTSYAHSGSASAYSGFYGDIYLNMPALSLPANPAQLTFWSYNSYPSYYNKNSVIISTDGINYTEIWSPTSVSQTWEKTTISLSAYTNQTVYIAFKYEGDNAHGWYVDDVTVEAPSCSAPDLSITGLTATITRGTFGTPVSYEMMLEGDDAHAITITIPATTTTFALNEVFTTIELNTNYSISVRTICGDQDNSEWSEPVEFTTPQCWESCIYTVEMNDSYGDGWNGNAIYVMVDGVQQESLTLELGSSAAVVNVIVCSGAVSFVWHTGSDPNETSFVIKNDAGTPLYTCSDGSELTDGQVVYSAYCGTLPTCGVPSVSVSGTTVTLTPNAYATVTPNAYEITIEGQTQIVTDVTFNVTSLFTTLASDATYQMSIRAICGEGDTSEVATAEVNIPFICQGTIAPYAVGTGTTTNSNLPSSSLYNYSLTQQLYTADEIGVPEGGHIYSLSFDITVAKERNIDIYIGTTTASSLSSWITDANFTKVYSGTAFASTGINEFNFTSQIAYNGTDNIVVMVDDNTGSWSSGLNARSHTNATNKAKYVFSDGTNYSVTSLSSYSGTTISTRNNIVFNICPNPVACATPKNITVGNTTETTAEVSWTAGGSETEWEVSYTIGDQTTTETTTDNPYTITGLSASTMYNFDFSIKSLCSATEESAVVTKTLSFNTACGLAAVPFAENFDAYTSTTTQSSMVMPLCWNRQFTGTNTSYGAGIYNSSSYAVSGTNSLRLYNTCSTSTSTSYGDVYAVLPQLDAAINELMISFDAKPSTTTSYNSFFEVGVITDVEATDYNSVFQPIGTAHIVPAGGQSFNILLSDYTGAEGNIAFRVTKTRPAGESRTGYYTHVYMDNLLVERIPTCFVPSSLTVSEVTDHTAAVNWADNYDQAAYAVEYMAEGDATWTSVSVDTTYALLNNLQASTNYTVRVKAVCGTNDESEYTDEVEFTTNCEHGIQIEFAGTLTSSYVPTNGNYNYSFSQQIFKSSEINAATTISGFEIEVSNTGSKARNIDIYMMHTSANEITSWLPMDNAQLVYSGVVAFTEGWQQINFDTPFNYNGTDNLVLIVDDNTGSWGSYPTFRTHDGGSNIARYYYDDSYNPDPLNPSATAAGTGTTNRNNIRITNCPEATDLAITEVSEFVDACDIDGAVTIGVRNMGYEGTVSAFEAYYQVNEETPVHESVTLATPIAFNEAATYTFNQLPVFSAGENIITAWVELTGDLVDGNNTKVSAPITVLDPIAVPYVEEFTGLTINHGWNPIDANNDGITMNLNNNINYTFNDEAAADDWMMSPCIEMAAGTYTIIYDYKANSSLTESFEVFYGNGAHIADMTNAVATHTFNNTTVETATTTITIPADGIYNFGFHATSLAGNLGFTIDNFKVYPVNDVIVTYNELGGTVTPNGTIAVNYGENLTLNLVPAPMYHVAGVWVDDVQVVPEDGTGANFMLYTLENVTEPHTVFVDFKLEFHIFKTVENFRADLYSEFGGAFVPAATDTTINPDPFTVNMVADPHYHLAGLTVSPMVPDNPEDVFADVVNNSDGTYSYTIDTLVVANYYVNATFRRDTVAINYNVLTGKGYANDSELLNAGETYTTWVDYSVYNDVDTTVAFAGTDTYHIVDVIVNGTSRGRIDSYTFENVTETQNVDLKFGYKIDASVVNYNTYGDIDIMDPQGTIEPATQYVPEYDAMTVTGTVAEHFHLYQLLVNGEDRIDEVVFGADFSTYSFTMDSVANNYTIVAVVKVDTFAITYNVLAGQGYADASDLLVAVDTFSTIVNYADNWYSNIVPATGYSIDNVTLDGQNLYTANNYQFNYIEESHVFDVTFVANTYTVATNAYGNGTVSDGISFTYDPENAVDYEFTATPAEGYYIASVTINNEAMEITDVDNFTYTIENVADNYVINVTFAVNTYTMTAEAAEGGNITPVGTQIVNYGTDVTYEINANEGWYISSTEIDGVTTTYTQEDAMVTLSVPYTSIDADHSVSVTFAQFMYIITGTVGANGTVNGETTINASLAYGSNYSLNIVPAANYHVADVVVDGQSVGAVEFYEFINVTANHTVDVTFEAIMYTLTATSNIEGCTITPATLTVQAGSSVPYSLNAAAGYHLVNVMANGEEVAVTNNSFTIIDVQSDYTIFANFAPDYVTVTVDQPAHATITPGTQTYAYGATPSYMIIPEVGYDIVSVTAGNGVVNVNYNNGIGTFTLDPVLADITLTATTQPKTFTITVVQGSNGTIAPATQTGVEYGSSVEFTITPDEFYVISDVIVDGSSRGAISGFTFNNVTNDHTITAVFEAACYMPTNLTAMNITSTSADLNWVGTAPSYEVRYRAAGETTYHTQTVNTTTLSLSGLTPNTLYSWGVKAICGSSLESEWAENGFTTRNGVGIADADMTSIKVYSFQNNVYIVNEDGIAISNVDIYDIYGKQVYTGKVLSSPEVISLNVAEGNYVVRLATENGVGVYKVAIVK